MDDLACSPQRRPWAFDPARAGPRDHARIIGRTDRTPGDAPHPRPANADSPAPETLVERVEMSESADGFGASVIWPDPIGPVQVLAVDIYWGEPLLYIARGGKGELYLVSYVDKVAVDADLWIAVSMSETRSAAVQAGEIDIRDAFRLPESRSVWEVVLAGSPSSTTIQELSPEELDEDMLAMEGARWGVGDGICL